MINWYDKLRDKNAQDIKSFTLSYIEAFLNILPLILECIKYAKGKVKIIASNNQIFKESRDEIYNNE